MATKSKRNVKTKTYYGKRKVGFMRRCYHFCILMAFIGGIAITMTLWRMDHNRLTAQLNDSAVATDTLAAMARESAQAEVLQARQEKAEWDRLPPPRL